MSENLLFNKLPPIYSYSKEVKSIQNSIDVERINMNSNLEDLKKQFYVETSTWSLYMWENMLGIRIDKSLSDYDRKQNIIAKIRGNKVFNSANLKELCKSYGGGKVQIIENFEDYSFIVKFIDENVSPSNMKGLELAINEMKPSHLNFSFQYLYNIWLQYKNTTWGNMKLRTWGGVKTENVIEDITSICGNVLCNQDTICGKL